MPPKTHDLYLLLELCRPHYSEIDIIVDKCAALNPYSSQPRYPWSDKKKSVLLANAPIAATLRPCREESVNFDTTENLYIEGDNLDVLKLLSETYLNRVKTIHIDPPYNTDNDFVYDDDFAEYMDEFLTRDVQYNEDGNRMVRNLDSNGRFHTDWLNMMYPRLRLCFRQYACEHGTDFQNLQSVNVKESFINAAHA